MLYLTEFHSVWLLLALILGGIIGWLSFLRGERGWSGAGWLALGIPVFLIGLAVAAFKLLSGKAGYWLDLGLLFFGTYMIGCLLGSLLRSLLTAQAEPASATAGAASSTTPAARTASNVAPAPTKAPVKPIVVAAGTAAAGAAALAAARGTHSATPAPTAANHPGKRPPALAANDTSSQDDLKLIKGIGPKNEGLLNGLGIRTFGQIAAWSPEEAEWMGHHMAFPGRIERELWINQAKVLSAGGDTEHSKAVRAGLPVNDEAMGDADIAKLKSGLPEVIGAIEGEDQHSGQRPFGTTKPLGGVADDLKLINGIGKQNEARLHGLGIWHHSQIAAWNRDNVDWVGSFLAFPGRIDREQWVEQAKTLAKGGTTEFAERVKRGEVATSDDDGSKGQNNVTKIKH